MKSVKLIVSKRVLNKVMRDFLNAVDASCGATDKTCSLTQGEFFAAMMHKEPGYRDFKYNIEQLMTEGSDYKNGFGFICANMGQRASYTKGFAQITKILLHEMGHQYTYHDIIRLYSEKEMDRLYYEAESVADNEKYIHVPAEWVATQWAIDWLADAEHRKIAREFEKKFWACFK